IMDVPPLPDRVFDFLMDEPHPAFAFFTPGPLPDYVGNPNNTNGWLEEDKPLPMDMMEPVVEPIMVVEMEELVDPVVEAANE
ncbi:hypothetical protein Tco_0387653, partial [Tanacetum coccineum]